MDTVLDHLIEQTPGVCGGKPRLAGTRFTVDDVVLLHLRLGQSIEEIAATYDFSLAALHAALAFYYDHREEVEARIERDYAFGEALREATPSVLRAKLARLSRG